MWLQPNLERLYCFKSDQYHWRHRSVDADSQGKRSLRKSAKRKNEDSLFTEIRPQYIYIRSWNSYLL